MEIFEILEPFYKLTLSMQSTAERGEKGSLWEVMPSVIILLKHMEQQRDKYASLDSQMEYATSTTKHLATATNNC